MRRPRRQRRRPRWERRLQRRRRLVGGPGSCAAVLSADGLHAHTRGETAGPATGAVKLRPSRVSLLHSTHLLLDLLQRSRCRLKVQAGQAGAHRVPRVGLRATAGVRLALRGVTDATERHESRATKDGPCKRRMLRMLGRRQAARRGSSFPLFWFSLAATVHSTSCPTKLLYAAAAARIIKLVCRTRQAARPAASTSGKRHPRPPAALLCDDCTQSGQAHACMAGKRCEVWYEETDQTDQANQQLSFHQRHQY